MKRVWQTSDDRTWRTKREAEIHEAFIALVATLQEAFDESWTAEDLGRFIGYNPGPIKKYFAVAYPKKRKKNDQSVAAVPDSAD